MATLRALKNVPFSMFMPGKAGTDYHAAARVEKGEEFEVKDDKAAKRLKALGYAK